jgi:hypothetical protein
MLLKSSDKLINRVSKGVLRHPLQVLPFQHRNQQKSVGQNLWLCARHRMFRLPHRLRGGSNLALNTCQSFRFT